MNLSQKKIWKSEIDKIDVIISDRRFWHIVFPSEPIRHIFLLYSFRYLNGVQYTCLSLALLRYSRPKWELCRTNLGIKEACRRSAAMAATVFFFSHHNFPRWCHKNLSEGPFIWSYLIWNWVIQDHLTVYILLLIERINVLTPIGGW